MKPKNKGRTHYKKKPKKLGGPFQPSEAFTRYLMLVQSIQNESESNFLDDLIAQREVVTKEIIARKSYSLSEVYEKLYIWRAECFEPMEGGEICFEDQFPLSAFYDLRSFIAHDGFSTALEKDLENRLRYPEEFKRRQAIREELSNAKAVPGQSDRRKLH